MSAVLVWIETFKGQALNAGREALGGAGKPSAQVTCWRNASASP